MNKMQLSLNESMYLSALGDLLSQRLCLRRNWSDSARLQTRMVHSISVRIVTPPVGVRRSVINPNPAVCASICLSVYMSLCPRAYLSNRWTDPHEIYNAQIPVVVARSSSGSVALRYVLPVLWMTSRLAVMGATPKGGCTMQRRW